MVNFNGQTQRTFFNLSLSEQLDMNNRYVQLRNNLDFEHLLNSLSGAYNDFGRPSLPLSLMVGLNLVKFIDNLSDAKTLQAYSENPYVQYFCGETEFQTKVPCTESMLSVFRKRIGPEGCDEILKASVKLFGEYSEESIVIADTTAQPKNITFPTDVKILNKVIVRCQKLAKKYGIRLNNTYRDQVKELLKTLRFEKGKEKESKVKKARKRLITIAGILVREITRKMSDEQRNENDIDLLNYNKVIQQSKGPKKSSTELAEEIENCLSIKNELEGLLKDNNIKISKSDQEKISNIVDSYTNAKGRGKEKVIRESVNGIKKICKRWLKRLEKRLDLKEENEITKYLERVKDLLATNKKDTKIYSLHEPGVACIAKGKDGKKYEFGSKASLAITKTSGIIVGAVNFQGNPHDSNTLDETIKHAEKITGKKPDEAYGDRGYRGAQEKNPEIKVHIPSTPTGEMQPEKKEEVKKNFGRRSSIEPIIGHVKNDFRLAKTYLRGEIGDKINLILSCAAFNLQKWLNYNNGKIKMSA